MEKATSSLNCSRARQSEQEKEKKKRGARRISFSKMQEIDAPIFLDRRSFQGLALMIITVCILWEGGRGTMNFEGWLRSSLVPVCKGGMCRDLLLQGTAES